MASRTLVKMVVFSKISYQYLVVHDGVDEDGDAVLGEDLLWRDLVGGRPHVDLLVDVHAGDDEEHPRTSGSS